MMTVFQDDVPFKVDKNHSLSGGCDIDWSGVVGGIVLRTDFYVSDEGSDEIGCGTKSKPWKTIQHSVNAIAEFPSMNGKLPTLHIADGIYEEEVSIRSMKIILIGNMVNPSSVQINAQTNLRGILAVTSEVEIYGVQINSNSGSSVNRGLIEIRENAYVYVVNCIFNSDNSATTVFHTTSHGVVEINSTKLIGSKLYNYVFCAHNGLARFYFGNIIADSILSSGDFVLSQNGGNVRIPSPIALVAGKTITGRRYNAVNNAIIQYTNNLPLATVAGVVSNGGIALP